MIDSYCVSHVASAIGQEFMAFTPQFISTCVTVPGLLMTAAGRASIRLSTPVPGVPATESATVALLRAADAQVTSVQPAAMSCSTSETCQKVGSPADLLSPSVISQDEGGLI